MLKFDLEEKVLLIYSPLLEWPFLLSFINRGSIGNSFSVFLKCKGKIYVYIITLPRPTFMKLHWVYCCLLLFSLLERFKLMPFNLTSNRKDVLISLFLKTTYIYSWRKVSSAVNKVLHSFAQFDWLIWFINQSNWISKVIW